MTKFKLTPTIEEEEVDIATWPSSSGMISFNSTIWTCLYTMQSFHVIWEQVVLNFVWHSHSPFLIFFRWKSWNKHDRPSRYSLSKVKCVLYIAWVICRDQWRSYCLFILFRGKTMCLLRLHLSSCFHLRRKDREAIDE